MPKQFKATQTLATATHEDLCEYVADLSRQLAEILRHRGLSTIVGLLELASLEAERFAKAESVAIDK